jgi:hypothetical protein
MAKTPINIIQYANDYLADFEAYINGWRTSRPAYTAVGDKVVQSFALSPSSLARMHTNPRDFFAYVVKNKIAPENEDEEETAAMQTGSAFHTMILDRYCMGRNLRYMSQPHFITKNATNIAKEQHRLAVEALKEQYPDIIDFLPHKVWEEAQRYADLLVGQYTYQSKTQYINPQARHLLDNVIDTELYFSYQCPETGEEVRGYIDFYGQDPDTGRYYAGDLKIMSAGCDDRQMTYAIRDRKIPLAMHIYKTALQRIGIHIDDFYIVAVGEQIHSNIRRMPRISFTEGEKMYREAIYAFTTCKYSPNGIVAFLQSYEAMQDAYYF